MSLLRWTVSLEVAQPQDEGKIGEIQGRIKTLKWVLNDLNAEMQKAANGDFDEKK